MSFDRARVEFDHNRLLKRVANEVFQPLGLIQKGSSRVWFDDHGWWVVMVMFNASGFGKGSYLVVGSTPLWDPIDVVGVAYETRDTWDHPHAKSGTKFIDARRPDWWERDVRILAEGAAAHIQAIRATPHDVRTFLAFELEKPTNEMLGQSDLAIAAGLLGMNEVARDGSVDLERRLASFKDDDWFRPAWDGWVQTRLIDLQRAAGDRSAFLPLVADNVLRTRAAQKLPALPIDSIVEALDAASTNRTDQRSWWRRWTS
jgi:hypothetical protein